MAEIWPEDLPEEFIAIVEEGSRNGCSSLSGSVLGPIMNKLLTTINLLCFSVAANSIGSRFSDAQINVVILGR